MATALDTTSAIRGDSVSPEAKIRCLHILRHERDELARALAEEEVTPHLLYSLVSNKVITQHHVQTILKPGRTDVQKCVILWQCVEDSLSNSSEQGAACGGVLELVACLKELDLHLIAARLYPEQDSIGSESYASEMEDEFYLPDDDSRSSYSAAVNDLFEQPLTSRSEPAPDDLLGKLAGSGTIPISKLPTASMRGSVSSPSIGGSNMPRRKDSTCTLPPSFNSESHYHLRTSASEGDRLDSRMVAATIDVKITNEIHGPKDGYDSDDNIYRNCSTPRGLVFLANYSFKNSKEHRHREGSEMDVKNLQALFTQMGYYIPEVHHDLSKNDTMKALRKFQENPLHEKVHSCVFVIMSHGKDGDSFYTEDDMSISMHEVQDLFSNRCCPDLKGKPKLFVLQFCRGTQHDVGVPPLTLVSLSLDNNSHTDSAGLGLSQEMSEKRPTYTDMLFIYSTVEGFVSHRDPTCGTWLVKALCQVLMRHAHNEDLDQLLKLVKRKISTNISAEGSKQTAVIKDCGFLKKFYFNPYNHDYQYGLGSVPAADSAVPSAAAVGNDGHLGTGTAGLLHEGTPGGSGVIVDTPVAMNSSSCPTTNPPAPPPVTAPSTLASTPVESGRRHSFHIELPYMKKLQEMQSQLMLDDKDDISSDEDCSMEILPRHSSGLSVADELKFKEEVASLPTLPNNYQTMVDLHPNPCGRPKDTGKVDQRQHGGRWSGRVFENNQMNSSCLGSTGSEPCFSSSSSSSLDFQQQQLCKTPPSHECDRQQSLDSQASSVCSSFSEAGDVFLVGNAALLRRESDVSLVFEPPQAPDSGATPTAALGALEDQLVDA